MIYLTLDCSHWEDILIIANFPYIPQIGSEINLSYKQIQRIAKKYILNDGYYVNANYKWKDQQKIDYVNSYHYDNSLKLIYNKETHNIEVDMSDISKYKYISNIRYDFKNENDCEITIFIAKEQPSKQ